MTARVKRRRMATSDALEYRLIFAAAFLLYLVAAALKRLWPGSSARSAAARKPVISEAWSAAHAAAGYAFMA